MTWMVRIVACGLLTVVLMAGATPASAGAGDEGLSNALVDGFYGGLIGALLGTAVMVMTDHPSDHENYITTGAALGVIAGTGYGLSKLTRYGMIEVDQQRVAWHVPTVETTARAAFGEPTEVRVSADLITFTFR